MKKFFVIVVLVFIGILFITSCETAKCPAYGHYSYYEVPAEE